MGSTCGVCREKRYNIVDIGYIYIFAFDPMEKKTITQKELDKYKREVKRLHKTKIPRCLYCKKNWKKVEEESGENHSTWEPDCNCIESPVRMSIG